VLAAWHTATLRLEQTHHALREEVRHLTEELHEKKPSCDPIPVGISLEEVERRLIEATLEHFDGHRERTAKALGIGVRTLSGKLRQYGYAPREKFVTNHDRW
jgi:DNA-binding NtrC family response regulator